MDPRTREEEARRRFDRIAQAARDLRDGLDAWGLAPEQVSVLDLRRLAERILLDAGASPDARDAGGAETGVAVRRRG